MRVIVAVLLLSIALGAADYVVARGVDNLIDNLMRCPSQPGSVPICSANSKEAAAFIPADGSAPIVLTMSTPEIVKVDGLKIWTTVEADREKGVLDSTSIKVSFCTDHTDPASCCDMGIIEMHCGMITHDECVVLDEDWHVFNVTGGDCSLQVGDNQVVLAVEESALAILLIRVEAHYGLTSEMIETMTPPWYPSQTQFAIGFIVIVLAIVIVLYKMGIIKRKKADICAVCNEEKEDLFECPQCKSKVCSVCFINDGTNYCCKNCIAYSGEYKYTSGLNEGAEMKTATKSEDSFKNLIADVAAGEVGNKADGVGPSEPDRKQAPEQGYAPQ
ncbi:MAG: hypothetical protein QGG26_08030 [Candidatus Undinarchaeales archaeon]|nr:hypothetical protein [Candidatus Undinarchaeales archaeon]